MKARTEPKALAPMPYEPTYPAKADDVLQSMDPTYMPPPTQILGVTSILSFCNTLPSMALVPSSHLFSSLSSTCFACLSRRAMGWCSTDSSRRTPSRHSSCCATTTSSTARWHRPPSLSAGRLSQPRTTQNRSSPCGCRSLHCPCAMICPSMIRSICAASVGANMTISSAQRKSEVHK